MNDLDRAQQFVAGARAEYEPSRADRERVRRHLGARLAAAGLAGSAAANVAGAAAAQGGSWLAGNTLLGLGKLAVGTMFVTIVTGTAIVASSRALSSRVRTTTMEQQSARAASTERAGAERTRDEERAVAPSASSSSEAALVVGATRGAAIGETPLAEATAPRAAGPSRSRYSARATASSSSATRAAVVPSGEVDLSPVGASDRGALDAELALLQDAKRQLTSSDYGSALTTLARLDREHRTGALLEEREALRVVIACKTGDAGQSERVTAFRARYASSVYMPRIEGVCGRAAMTDSTSTESVMDRNESGH